MGIRCHPAPTSLATQLLVRLLWEQAEFTPPMYTPMARYGDDDQADIVWVEGAEQASNPGPV